MATNNRGLGSDNMDADTKHTIQSMGGQTSRSGGTNRSTGGGKMSASDAGKLGAAAEPREAKQKGGHNSQRNR